MKNLSSFIVLSMLVPATHAQITTPQPAWWITDGSVHAVEHDPITNTTAIGGLFSYVGPNNPHGTEIDLGTGQVRPEMPRINGVVRCAVSDGVGGWYIGGSFTEVAGSPRLRLARILADGSLDAWAPSANGTVYSLLVHAGQLYVGGAFGQVNGIIRFRMAGFDIATGALTSWWANASLSSGVAYSLAALNGTIYVGGSLSTIVVAGTPYLRDHLMAVDATTNAMAPWAPVASHPVLNIVASGNQLYASGAFTSLNSVARNYCGALDASTGALLTWDPSPNLSASSTVGAMALHADRMFLGGSFTSLAGVPVNRLAAVDLATGAVYPTPVPEPSGGVTALAIDPAGTTVFASGPFTSVAGQPRRSLAAFDLATGTLAPLSVEQTNGAFVLAASSTGLFTGGGFTSCGGQSLTNFAVLTGATGAAITGQTNFGLNAAVRSITCAQGSWYLGGEFTSPGARLMEIDQSTGALGAWNPGANGTVTDLIANGTSAFAAGTFTTIAGLARNGLAEVSLTTNTNNATPWDPAPNGAVHSLQVSPNEVYAGGAFTTIGGAAHAGVAVLDRTTASALPIAMDINAGGVCHALWLDGTDLYIAGDLSTVNGQATGYSARLATQDGSVSPDFVGAATDGPITSLALQGSMLFCVGPFANYAGSPRNGAAAVDPWNGALLAFDPAFTGGAALHLAGASDRIILGGAFTGFNNFMGRSLAAYGACTGTEWFTDADGDGYGAPATMVFACEEPPGMIDQAEDCDDSDPLLFVGAVCDDGDPYSEFDAIDIGCNCIGKSYSIQARIFLNGPYVSNVGLMRDDLRAASLLPLTEPYTALGYVPHAQGGGETIAPAVLTVTGNNAVVDWVFLELRGQSQPSQVVATRCCLLQRDGDVVDLDGTSPVRLYVPSGQYHLAMRHRNHLGVMTAGTPEFTTGTPVTVYFDLPATATYGTNAQRDVSGVHTLWSGDVTGNGQVKYAGGNNDRDPILVAIGGNVPTATVSGYLGTDCTLDGVVKYAGGNNDRDRILQTVGGNVPTAVRNAQLP